MPSSPLARGHPASPRPLAGQPKTRNSKQSAGGGGVRCCWWTLCTARKRLPAARTPAARTVAGPLPPARLLASSSRPAARSRKPAAGEHCSGPAPSLCCRCCHCCSSSMCLFTLPTAVCRCPSFWLLHLQPWCNQLSQQRMGAVVPVDHVGVAVRNHCDSAASLRAKPGWCQHSVIGEAEGSTRVAARIAAI